jgi:hypothetical protein
MLYGAKLSQGYSAWMRQQILQPQMPLKVLTGMLEAIATAACNAHLWPFPTLPVHCL